MGKREERGVPIELYYWSQIKQLLCKAESGYVQLGYHFMDLSNDKQSEDPWLFERLAKANFDSACAVSKLTDDIYKIFYPEVKYHE